MKPIHAFAVIALAVALVASAPLHAELLEKTANIGGVTVQYKVVLPNDYDPAKTYPGILVGLARDPVPILIHDTPVQRRDLRAQRQRVAAVERQCRIELEGVGNGVERGH